MFAISTGYRDHREWAMSWLSIGAAGLEAVDHSGMDVRDPQAIASHSGSRHVLSLVHGLLFWWT